MKLKKNKKFKIKIKIKINHKKFDDQSKEKFLICI
jgi:hypothetical protein